MLNQNPKILLLTGLLYPDVFGGSGKLVYYQAKELLAQGFDVTILTRKTKASQPDQETLEGLKIQRYGFEYSKIWGKSLTDLLILPGIINKLGQKENFDSVIYYDHFQARAYKKSGLNLPSIFVFLSSYAQELALEGLERKLGWNWLDLKMKRTWVKFLTKIEINNLKQAEKIVVLSKFSKDLILEIAPEVRSEKIEIIPAGVDTVLFKPAPDLTQLRQQLNLPQNKLIFLTVRRLVARTGLENLITAASQYKKVSQDFILLIIGSGVLAEKLQKQTEDLGLGDNIKFLGSLAEAELIKYYQAADLFILPTLAYEGFGLVTLEAMACGTPVIGTPVGATPEILTKFDSSYILKTNQASAIFQGLVDFAEQNNQGKTAELSNRVRLFIEQNYSWITTGQKLAEIIKLLNG